jgi:hypothetical protein
MTQNEQMNDAEAQTVNHPDEMTEQIDASFGPMTVYVSGTDQDDVLETFNDVWETMMSTSDHMHDRKEDMDDDDGPAPGRTFGD